MSHPRRQGLILDFGGVLTTPVSESARAFCLSEGLAPDAFADVVSADPVGRELFADLERGVLPQAEWNARTADLLGVGATNLLGRVLAEVRPEPVLVGAARAARAAGVRVGVLSNSLGSGPYDPYEGHELGTRYDVVVLSGDHGLRKPEPGLYAIMLERMDLPAAACVYVDDSARNLTPAQDLGMAVVRHTAPADTVVRLEELLGVPLGG
ncbi:HAD-IA family hydrolase [Streptomyces griseocarneus]|uniref:HAD-IA family hydrolase n=1 Tax=Streptomyces griseocarneus TaxID=51201 RepID=UPI00167E5B9B|nr:HAD-IA family hydrolase [Streptomyces griseocarneus]MBZ6477786.1 HAD-IA family hydrolase [Streptomyces griseocarneus]GHG61082.1 phosphoglycolate phosphatase [Streptomyces griseocarneus]